MTYLWLGNDVSIAKDRVDVVRISLKVSKVRTEGNQQRDATITKLSGHVKN